MRILGLSCSPREGANSGIMLDRSFERLRAVYSSQVETEVIALRELNLNACIACNVCGKTKDDGRFIPCVQADKDDVQMVLDKMVASDGICVTTPVHFGLPSELFLKLMMRTRLLRHQDFRLANRPVGIMATAARRSGGAETAVLAAWLPFVRNACILVGSGNGTSQCGAFGWAGERGHIESDEWGLEQGFQVAERVFEIARLIKAGSEALNYLNPMRFSYSEGTRPVVLRKEFR